MAKTPEQVRVSNIEHNLNSNHGYTLKTKVVPDKDPIILGDTVWTVEATSRLEGHSFTSVQIKSKDVGTVNCYLRALESVSAQIQAFYEARGIRY